MILTGLMAHPREELQDALIALLAGANTDAGARVHMSRIDPFRKGAVPAISVYILREEIDREASEQTSPRELKRIADAEVVLTDVGPDEATVLRKLNALAYQVEAALDSDPYIGGKAEDSILDSTGIQIGEVDGRSDPLVGVAMLTYAMTYRTQPAEPDDLDDFLRVKATHQVAGGIEGTEPVDDEFAVQEPEES